MSSTYGDEGRGVAIEFSLVTDQQEWFETHISEIIYGSKNRVKFSQLYKEVNILKKEISLDVLKLCVFHKSRIYQIEREVRILYDGRLEKPGRRGRKIEFNGAQIFPIFENDKGLIRYLKLPLFTSSTYIDNYEEIPLLKIEGVYIGYQHKNDSRLKETFSNLVSKNLGYYPEIHFSRLVKPYWGKIHSEK